MSLPIDPNLTLQLAAKAQVSLGVARTFLRGERNMASASSSVSHRLVRAAQELGLKLPAERANAA